MLDIIFTLFKTIVHGITTIIKLILSIPSYLAYVVGFLSFIPPFIAVPLTIAVIASILIGIKRLVL